MGKTSVAFLLVVLIANSLCDVNTSVNKEACIKDADVNPSYVERASNGELVDARELKCYFKCYFENAGYMDSNGVIQEDKLRANMPSGISKNMASKAITLCVARKGKDPKDGCETAYQVQKCLIENNLKY